MLKIMDRGFQKCLKCGGGDLIHSDLPPKLVRIKKSIGRRHRKKTLGKKSLLGSKTDMSCGKHGCFKLLFVSEPENSFWPSVNFSKKI